MEKNKSIEITRSYSQKVSHPTNRFENSDFFCSAKAEVGEDEAIKKSAELFKICQSEVEKSIKEYQERPQVNVEELRKKGEEFQERYNKESELQEIKTANAEAELATITEDNPNVPELVQSPKDAGE